MSTIVISCLFEMCRLYGGFYTSPAQFTDLPGMDPWRFADGLSYIKYAFIGVALNEMHDLTLTCTPGVSACVSQGSTLIDQKGYDEYTISFCAGMLIMYIVGYRILAYLGLRFIKF